MWQAQVTSNDLGNDSMVVWKYKSDGTLDTTFSNDGIVTASHDYGGWGHSITLDSVGNIYVAGYGYDDAYFYMMTWKFRSDGS